MEKQLVLGNVALQCKVRLLCTRDASFRSCQQNLGEATAELGMISEIHPGFHLRIVVGIGDVVLDGGKEVKMVCYSSKQW